METWQHATPANIRGFLILSVLTPQAQHDTRGGVSEHNGCSLMEGCFCQGVGWLRLDKQDACCLGPNLSHQEALKARQRAACMCHVCILDLWLSRWFYICFGCTDAQSGCTRSLLPPGDQELRFKGAHFTSAFVWDCTSQCELHNSNGTRSPMSLILEPLALPASKRVTNLICRRNLTTQPMWLFHHSRMTLFFIVIAFCRE